MKIIRRIATIIAYSTAFLAVLALFTVISTNLIDLTFQMRTAQANFILLILGIIVASVVTKKFYKPILPDFLKEHPQIH